MRVLVTRPAEQARAWVQRLQAAGLDAAALPLIGIGPPADPQPVRAAWDDLGRWRLVMFVSPNAVSQFFALKPPGADWTAVASRPIAASPGPGTSQALREHGVPAESLVEPAADAPQFDSEALWRELRRQDWTGARVLFVRGEDGRDWLAERLREAGAVVEWLTAYRRGAPRLQPDEQALLDQALRTPADHLWWFSSSEAIEHLAALAPPPQAWPQAQALATHPKIAESARRLGFGRVVEARPAADEVLAVIRRSIESAVR